MGIVIVTQALLGRRPNSLLPLARSNGAVMESFGKSESHGPKRFCDLCRKLPCHRNSDHDLTSFNFKEREFSTLPISANCAGVAQARKSFLRFHFKRTKNQFG